MASFFPINSSLIPNSNLKAKNGGGMLKAIAIKGNPPSFVSTQGRRIVAVGDLHGDLSKTRCALEIAGVLSSDGQDTWTGGETSLEEANRYLYKIYKDEVKINDDLMDEIKRLQQLIDGTISMPVECQRRCTVLGPSLEEWKKKHNELQALFLVHLRESREVRQDNTDLRARLSNIRPSAISLLDLACDSKEYNRVLHRAPIGNNLEQRIRDLEGALSSLLLRYNSMKAEYDIRAAKSDEELARELQEALNEGLPEGEKAPLYPPGVTKKEAKRRPALPGLSIQEPTEEDIRLLRRKDDYEGKGKKHIE